ncbi:MAG: polyprenyl synthetase family protein [Aerococcus sp.]|nr:polyprenyl synthetase family protein [Aerococcus sp.]
MKLKEFQQQVTPKLEEALREPFQANDSRLRESMYYALESGGKRLRPLLVLALSQALGEITALSWQAACAIEYMHTYSLIHDDLPAMDNDDYRRGRLSVHKAYDEATAILAGDALQTIAFEALSKPTDQLDRQLQLVQLLATASGDSGMVEGQMKDIAAEHQTLTLDELKMLHRQKTGELIRFSVLAGAISVKADEETLDLIQQFAEHYGLAYQIQNDLQEVLWDDEQRGKKQTSDQNLEKNTYPALLRVNGALEALKQERIACQDVLSHLKEHDPAVDTTLLSGFLDYLAI